MRAGESEANRAFDAMMTMKNIDVAVIEAATVARVILVRRHLSNAVIAGAKQALV